jgi:hypothetical protein
VGRARRSRGPQGKGGALRPPRWTTVGEAPEPPAGWSLAPPDFVGVGAQRAGTKWWYELIVDHPAVARVASTKKELHYFDRFWRDPFGADEAAAYARFFPRPAGAVCGEWTPRYMHDPWTPALLARAAPEARVLMMLRDPIARYESGVAREQRLADKRGEPLEAAVWSDAFARGLYGMQLERLLEHFARERVLVLQYERCAAEPAAELRRTYEFLGVETGHEPTALRDHVGRVNVKDELPAHVREQLAAAYRGDLERLRRLVPELDLGLWPTARSS